MDFKKSLEGRTLKDHSGEERYRLVRLIGEGGFGHVYEAQDLKFDSHRRVAVKVVKPGFARQIRREAILGQIEHPNVVRYLDYGTDGDFPYVVMEYLSGRSLDKVGRLSEENLHKFVRHVCSALQRAHEGNLVHRDLKPQNIMLVDEGRPEERFVILDFGIASQLDATQSLRGATMDGAGTPEYMSPEQLRGDEPTQESDIYSFAVILYQQLTGRVPFQMETPSLPAFFELITNNDAPRFRDAVGDGRLSSLAEETEGVILRCLSKNPQGRVTSVREILNAFDEVLGKPGQEHQNLAQTFGESEESLRKGINQNGSSANQFEELDLYQESPGSASDHNDDPPVDSPTRKPEQPPQHVLPSHTGPLDSPGPVNGTLTPEALSHTPGKFESGTTSETSYEADVLIPQKKDFSEEEFASGFPRNPVRRQRSGFPIGKISAALVVFAVILFAMVLYPLIRRNRLENRLERSLENSGYADAAQTVNDIDLLTQLWVDKDNWMQSIREAGNHKARDYADDRSWDDAITECVLLNDVFPGDPESRQILKKIAGTIEHHVEIDTDANRYAEAVAYLNRTQKNIVEKLVQFDTELISPELLTKKIRSKGLETIDSYLGRNRPREAVRIGVDLQRAFPQDLDVNREVIRAKIALHSADGIQFSKVKLFSKAADEYTQALKLASNPSQKSSLTLERARTYKNWAEENDKQNTKQDQILNRFGAALEDIKSILNEKTPISGAHTLQAETFLSRAKFYLKQADALDAENQRRQKNEHVRSAIEDLHLALSGPLDEEHRKIPTEHLQNIAAVFLADGRSDFVQALNLSNTGQNVLSAETDQKYQASIESLNIAISAQDHQAAGYFFRAGARTHLRNPDFDGSLKDFQTFEQLAQEQLAAGHDPPNDLFVLNISLAKSYSLHAWILATCSEKNFPDGKKSLELAVRAEEIFDSLEGKLPDADWLMARSDVFKSKSAAYAQMGDFEKAITSTERILVDLTAPKADKSKADYTTEEVEWTLHKILIEQYYKKKILPPFRFR